MDDKEQKIVFSRNLNRLLSDAGKTQREVADSIHVLYSTFNTWCQGVALPRMGKVQLLADYFNVPKSALIDDLPSSSPATSPLPLTEPEQSLIGDYRMLNHTGKAEAGKRVHELTQIDIYKKDTALSDDMGIA